MLFVKVVRKIAVTVEEIEIIVRAKVAEALGELRSLQAELKRTGQADKISSYAKTAAPTVIKAAEAMKQPSVEIQKAATAAADKYGDLDKIIQRVEERAKKAAEQTGKVSHPKTAELSGAKVLTPTKPLDDYLDDKLSYGDLMKSLNKPQQTSRFLKAMERVTTVLKKFGPVGQAAARKVAVAIGQATDETKKYENQVNKSASKAKGSFSDLAKRIKSVFVSTVLYSGMRKLFSFLGGGIREAVSAPETENLFRVALGNLSNDAEDFAVNMKNSLGIDEYVSKNMIGTFQQIGTAVGVASNTAFGMSKSMTMLANDMASLYNVDPEQAYENLQSALTGQGRAVRKYGFVITEQTVKEAAYRHGLAKTGQELTEQQKYVARGIALMEQSKNAQGDMSRTLGNIQNQIRILKQNITAAKRSIGQAFIPTIQAALPWLNAFAVLLQRAGVALARWSYARHGMNYDEEMAKQKKVINGYNGIAAAEENIGESAEKAGKKAQRSLLPIDQINRLQAPDKGSDSAGSGSSAPYDPGWDYEPDLSGVTAFEDEVAILEEKIRKLLPVISSVASGFATWKIGKTIFKGLESILGVKGLKGVARELETTPGAIAAVSGAVVICAWRFGELYAESERFRKGLSTIWDVLKNGAKKSFDFVIDLYKNLLRSMIPETLYKKFSAVIEALDIDMHDYGMIVAAVFGLLLPGGRLVSGILVGFEAVTLAIRAVGYAAEDAVQPVDIFQDGISNITKQKVETFVQQLRNLDDTVKSLDWGDKIVTQEDVDKVSKNVKAIRETIIKELDADHNEALKNLNPLRKNLGEEAYQGLIASTDKYYAQQKQKTMDAESQINAIMKEAADKNRKLRDDENAKIAELQEQMKTTGIEALSETEAESLAIMRRMKENNTRVSLEQASEIIKNAQKQRDEKIKAAETEYEKAVFYAKKQLEAGVITEEQYAQIESAAKEHKDEMVSKAEETYSGIYNSVSANLGETSKYIDWETGNIKSRWDVWLDDTKTAVKSCYNNIKSDLVNWWSGVEKWFNESVAPKFTKEYWKNKLSGLTSGAREKLNELKKMFESWTAKIKTPRMYWDKNEGYKATGAVKAVLETLQLPTIIPKLKVQWMAMGGIVKKRQLIGAGEAGAEAIVPLERNLGWIKKLSKHIADELESYASIPTVTTSQFELPESRLQYQPRGLTSNNLSASFNNSDDRHLRRIVFLLERILGTVKDLDFSFAIGDDEVYRSAVRGGRREALATGKPAFGL